MKISPVVLKTVAFLLPAVAFIIYYNLRMDKERYEPYIYTLTGGKVLVAKISGNPDSTIDTAQITMYSAGRKLKLSPSYISARHPDWNQRETTPRENWIIYYSRMVPETATDLADIKDSAHVSISFDRRKPTKIAEILHLGMYDDIPKSLAKLRQFIDREGYKISGFYEEVYLVFEDIEADPNKYETLLRYEITR